MVHSRTGHALESEVASRRGLPARLRLVGLAEVVLEAELEPELEAVGSS